MNNITYNDVCELIGIPVIQNKLAQNVLQSIDTTYQVIENDAREALMYDVLKRIDSNEMSSAGNIEKWERGWGENLTQFRKTKDFNDLVPRFRTNHNMCRFNNQFIIPTSEHLETIIYEAIDYLIFEKYLSNVTAVYDFGCGTGISLKHISDMYPHLELHGFDWSMKSVEIIEAIREIVGINIYGHLFDMKRPNAHYTIPKWKRSAIITGGALEQLGEDFEPFLQFMLSCRPQIVIHFEPILELYEDTLFDYIAYKHGIKRKYLNGYYTRLKELESQGKILILKVQHTRLGNPFQDGHSIIIWMMGHTPKRKLLENFQ